MALLGQYRPIVALHSLAKHGQAWITRRGQVRPGLVIPGFFDQVQSIVMAALGMGTFFILSHSRVDGLEGEDVCTIEV